MKKNGPKNILMLLNFQPLNNEVFD
ncbi:hypothetical protein ENC_34770 [Enterobacter hormaechei]|nr:hypothetical protein ENC_34770 [Enterobacter hormaechei]